MIRFIFASLATLGIVAFAASARPSYFLGQIAPKADRAEESRRELIDRIKVNQERVRKLLGEKNSGEVTRRLQREIAADLAKLLETPDEPNASPPMPGQRPKAPDREIKEPAPQGAQKSMPKQPGAIGTEGRTNAKEKRAGQPADGYWGQHSPQLRKELESYPRDRLMPAYEELLRAYYRTLAERAPDKEGDQR